MHQHDFGAVTSFMRTIRTDHCLRWWRHWLSPEQQTLVRRALRDGKKVRVFRDSDDLEQDCRHLSLRDHKRVMKGLIRVVRNSRVFCLIND